MATAPTLDAPKSDPPGDGPRFRAVHRSPSGRVDRQWPVDRIAEALEVSAATVERVRRRFVEQGLDAALDRKRRERPARQPKLDGRAEARLIALACSAPPEGRAVWTMQLLADKLVELEVVDSISDETVRVALKKTRSSRG